MVPGENKEAKVLRHYIPIKIVFHNEYINPWLGIQNTFAFGLITAFSFLSLNLRPKSSGFAIYVAFDNIFHISFFKEFI
jgi:hypothetical protein